MYEVILSNDTNFHVVFYNYGILRFLVLHTLNVHVSLNIQTQGIILIITAITTKFIIHFAVTWMFNCRYPVTTTCVMIL